MDVKKISPPTGSKLPPNNTNISETENNDTKNILSGKPDYITIIHEVIDYLNNRLGTRYKYTSAKTVPHIKARVNEGFTVDDFKVVIDKKFSDWKGTEWEKFLRPETLFGTKFEGYLNEKSFKQQTQSDSGAGSTTLYI
jgi:uncharacterized phage protein (TIGR02220 family)